MKSLQELTIGDLSSLAAVLLLANIGALWKTASLRGDIHNKWRQRVGLAEAGLSENAANELRSLFRQIEDLLSPGRDFDPLRVIANPGALVASATRFKRLIQKRDQLQRRFGLLLKLGPTLFFSFFSLALGLMLGFCYLLGILESQIAWWAAVGVTVISLAVLIVGFALYVVLQSWLSEAEILSVPEELDG